MAFGPRHFVAPAAAFTMAIVLGLYVRNSIHRARWDAKYERMKQEEARTAPKNLEQGPANQGAGRTDRPASP